MNAFVEFNERNSILTSHQLRFPRNITMYMCKLSFFFFFYIYTVTELDLSKNYIKKLLIFLGLMVKTLLQLNLIYIYKPICMNYRA